jgi:hypothetical protein
VPLPNSSTIASDLKVPNLRILLVSSISTKKVDLPSSILSEAPSLVNILSVGVSTHFFAGT